MEDAVPVAILAKVVGHAMEGVVADWAAMKVVRLCCSFGEAPSATEGATTIKPEDTLADETATSLVMPAGH